MRDITKEAVDAIVNPINNSFKMPENGISKAIYDAAGGQ